MMQTKKDDEQYNSKRMEFDVSNLTKRQLEVLFELPDDEEQHNCLALQYCHKYDIAAQRIIKDFAYFASKSILERLCRRKLTKNVHILHLRKLCQLQLDYLNAIQPEPESDLEEDTDSETEFTVDGLREFLNTLTIRDDIAN